jgi:hypothetical protein
MQITLEFVKISCSSNLNFITIDNLGFDFVKIVKLVDVVNFKMNFTSFTAFKVFVCYHL